MHACIHTPTDLCAFAAHSDTMDIRGSACRRTEAMQSRGREWWKMDIILLLFLPCYRSVCHSFLVYLVLRLRLFLLLSAQEFLAAYSRHRLPHLMQASRELQNQSMQNTSEWVVGGKGGTQQKNSCVLVKFIGLVHKCVQYTRCSHSMFEHCSPLCCEHRPSSRLLLTRLGPALFVWTWPLPKPITGWCAG